jgi:glycosyltransferase involved in cell wall biosynthesis
MRILHVNKFLHRKGGAEGYMLDLADLQRQHGHEVAFYGMDHPNNDQVSAGTPASYAEFEPAPDGVTAKVALAGRMIWSRQAAKGMDEAIAAFRPDVVHAHNIYHQLSPSVVHAAARRDVPVVLTMHDYKLACPTYKFLDHGKPCTACVTKGPWEAARRGCNGSRAGSTVAAIEVSLHRRFGAYDGVRRFISPSRFLAEQMTAAGIYPDRIRVQSNFTDIDLEPRTAEATGAAVFAGRLSSEKGVDTLVRAIGRAAGALEDRDGVLLDVAGDGPERDELEALAETVAPGRVRFHGHMARADLQDLIRSAAVSVVPSRWHENQPLAVLESFALGVPVLGTDLGGLPEMVDDETGWVVPANDDEAMSAALVRALSDPWGTHQRGVNARERVEERHAPSTHLAAIEAIYEEAGVTS